MIVGLFRRARPLVFFAPNNPESGKIRKRSTLWKMASNIFLATAILAANFPTLFFWKPDLTELRASVQEHHDSMCSVGVFHESPESAVEKLNQIYSDESTIDLENFLGLKRKMRYSLKRKLY